MVFFQDTYESKVPNTITHVAIYAGNDQLIHASADKVKITPFDQYWKNHFKGIGSFSLLARNYNKQIAENNYQKLNKIKNPNSSLLTPSTTDLVASTEALKPLLPEQKLPEPSVHPAPGANSASQPEFRSGFLALDTSKLDALGRAFFDEWNVVFTGSLPTSLKKGEMANFQLHITKKATGEKFNGILKQPIILVANSTNLNIDPVAISLVKDGEVQIKLKAQQSGVVYTAINLGLNKI